MRIRYLVLALLILAMLPSGALADVYLFHATETGFEWDCNFAETGGVGTQYQVAVVYEGYAVEGFTFSVGVADIPWFLLTWASPYALTQISANEFHVSLGLCQPLSATVVATLTFVSGGSGCGDVYLGTANYPHVDATTCDQQPFTLPAHPLFVNAGYGFDGYHSYCTCAVVGTESSTWGKVKALYRD